MKEGPAGTDLDARRAAFELAFDSRRSPLPYEKQTDEQLLPEVHRRAPSSSKDECLDALAAVRRLCDDVYDVCNEFRDGGFGAGASARLAATSELAGRRPGFTAAEYEAAFSAGLLWTAF